MNHSRLTLFLEIHIWPKNKLYLLKLFTLTTTSQYLDVTGVNHEEVSSLHTGKNKLFLR